MRVLFVNRMASMVRGGGETFDLEISRRLAQLGVEVSYLSGIPLFGRATIPVDAPRAHTLRSPYTGWFPWDRVRGGWRLRLADFYIFEKSAAAWAAARSSQFDVVQVCELPTFVTNWKRRGMKIPVVMRLTAPDYHDAAGAIKVADAIIASGATMEKVKRGPRPDCENIPNGVDTEMFRPQASDFRARHGIAADEIVVLFVARFQSVKNHRMLMDAFAQLYAKRPASRLVLAGSGPLENEIRRQAETLGIRDRVLFLGEFSFRALPAVYAAADIKVISSDYESFCFAALEAMASGLPLVVTRTDWVPRLIGMGEGGRIVPIGDAAAFSAALLELAGSPDVRARMGEWNRRQAVEHYGWSGSARKLLDLYERLLSRA